MLKKTPMQNEITVNPTPKILPYAWVILSVVYLASVAAAFNQQKVPPILPVLMDEFQMSLSLSGGLMSVFALTGVILALPAGFILQRIGPKITVLIAVGSLVVGSALGAVATTASALLISRVIEGIGLGLVAVAAPAIIALWFPADRQGAPLGIWATWVPLGAISAAVLAPRMAATQGWQSVWWLAAGLAMAAFLLFLVFMRRPPVLSQGQVSLPALNLRKALANRSSWFLAASFACFNLTFLGMGTFLPTFLADVRGYPLAEAAIIVNIPSLVILLSAPLAGWISDRFGSRKWVYSFGFLTLAAIIVLPFYLTGTGLIIYMLIQGLLIGGVPTAIFAAAPEVMQDPRLAGIAMAVLMLGQNIGMMIGPLLFGSLVTLIGWTAAAFCLIPVLLLGFLFGWLVKVR
jgi:MFS family permease